MKSVILERKTLMKEKTIKIKVNEKGEPVLPDGWTYLIHGSNTSQWNKNILKEDSFVVKGNEAGLYCVEREKAIENEKSGSNVSELHSEINSKEGESAFEIRCLIYKDLRRKKDREEFEGKLTSEEIEDINNYHINKPYYPAIPNKTKLIKIATTEFDEITNTEKEILWYVPEDYLQHYIEDSGLEIEQSKEDKEKYILNDKNIEIINENGKGFKRETRKLDGIEITSSKEYDNGTYDKRSRVFVADKGVKVSENYINYTTYRQQYNAETNIYTDTTQTPLIDEEGNVIGEQEYVETFKQKDGTREGRTFSTIEGEKGFYQIETESIKQGDNFSETSTMYIDNKLSGNKEKIEYRNENGKETYVYMENGVIGEKITKTERGTTIDIYKDGQPYETYEYDENGQAIIAMGVMEQLPNDYVKSQFDIVIPEYQTVEHDIPEEIYQEQQEEKIEQTIEMETNIEKEDEIEQVSTQKLGRETLEEQKNISQMNRIENDIQQQIQNQEREVTLNQEEVQVETQIEMEQEAEIQEEIEVEETKNFRDELKVELSTEEQVELVLNQWEKELENGDFEKEEKKKKDHIVERLDNEHIDRVM